MKKQIKVLIPVDFSPQSLALLDHALSWRDCVEVFCLLFHVVASGEVETFASLGGEPTQEQTKRIEGARERLESEAERRRSEEPSPQIECRVASGVPFKEICRVAESEAVDLILITTHGRTGLSHMLIGSTAERVVQHASCPVLSVRQSISR